VGAKPDLANFARSACDDLPGPTGGADLPPASSGKYLVVWVNNYAEDPLVAAPLTFQQAGVTQIDFRKRGESEPYLDLTFVSYGAAATLKANQQYWTTVLTGLDNERDRAGNKDLSTGDPLDVSVTTADNIYHKYFKYRKILAPYDVLGPVWLPIGLFGTHFSTNQNGLQFAAFPINLAIGGKWYATDSVYFGLSLILAWTIYSSSTSTGSSSSGMTASAASPSSTNSSFSVSAASLGLLLDVSNWFYVGGAYGYDFRTDVVQQPGAFLVVGVAPGLLQLMQSAPKAK
jgi:hypothetical protein